jgi:hypothetical protein
LSLVVDTVFARQSFDPGTTTAAIYERGLVTLFVILSRADGEGPRTRTRDLPATTGIERICACLFDVSYLEGDGNTFTASERSFAVCALRMTTGGQPTPAL